MLIMDHATIPDVSAFVSYPYGRGGGLWTMQQKH